MVGTPAATSGQHDFCELLRKHFAIVRQLDDRELAPLLRHYTLFETWNRTLNLSAVRDLEGAVVRHYCESLYLAANLPTGPLRVVDLGAGAGFPGFPVAVVRPECEVVLVESHQRKAVFLKEASRGLPNVRVFAGRAERLAGCFDWLISRAVAWRELKPHFVRLAPRAALLLGERDAAEVRQDGTALWREPRLLPWGKHRVLLVGERST